MTPRPLTLSPPQAEALDSDLALKLLSACSDLALLVGEDDVIHDAASSGSQPALAAAAADWVGRRWSDVVTSESRAKVEALLQDARAAQPGVARQVNHALPDGPNIPLLFSAAELDPTSSVIALARDMSPMAQMQQRLMQAQQTLERDYARLMEMERRYRMLFQVTSTGVLMVDAASGDILEANTAAVALLAPGALRIAGRRFPEGFDRLSTQTLLRAMDTARSQGLVEDAPARRLSDGLACRVSLHLFHEGGTPLLLVRVVPLGDGDGGPGERTRQLAECLQLSPDPFAALGSDGRILHANAAFVAAVHAPGEEAVRRQPLERYIGRSAVDLDVLLANLREGGGVRAFATVLKTEDGLTSEVEVSAASPPGGAPLGFFIRIVARRLAPTGAETASASPEQATELVGRLPLKDIVGRSSDVIEDLCIRHALELTGDNRAAAAELLGLSRQTLYAKLRRLGFADEGPAP